MKEKEARKIINNEFPDLRKEDINQYYTLVALLIKYGAEGITYHCDCGAKHDRGPIDGKNVYRCLKCGNTIKVIGEK